MLNGINSALTSTNQVVDLPVNEERREAVLTALRSGRTPSSVAAEMGVSLRSLIGILYWGGAR